MTRKTIDASTVRRIAAELDCAGATVRRVFVTRRTPYAVSRRIFAVLVRDGLLQESDRVEDGNDEQE